MGVNRVGRREQRRHKEKSVEPRHNKMFENASSVEAVARCDEPANRKHQPASVFKATGSGDLCSHGFVEVDDQP